MELKLMLNKKGFTLVEVLVAVGAISVASLAFLPSFTNANREKNLQQNAETVKDAIATARNRALTNVGNPEATDAFKYKYSGVKFTAGISTYTLFRSKGASTDICDNLESSPDVVIDDTKNLSNNVIAKIKTEDSDPVDDIKSPTCIYFEFGTGNASISEGAPTDPLNASPCNN